MTMTGYARLEHPNYPANAESPDRTVVFGACSTSSAQRELAASHSVRTRTRISPSIYANELMYKMVCGCTMNVTSTINIGSFWCRPTSCQQTAPPNVSLPQCSGFPGAAS